MTEQATTHEYAGFTYYIRGDWPDLTAVPLPGQHPAAAKDKHRRAAVETFKQENGL